MLIQIFEGKTIIDAKGVISFVNDFHFKKVKRFYQIVLGDKEIIRAFHGHMKEAKFAYVVSGSVLLCAAPLDNPQFPSKQVKMERFILSGENPKIVYIPPKYANGFKSLGKNSIVIFFSTKSLSESLKDDYRYPFDYWGKEIWNI